MNRGATSAGIFYLLAVPITYLYFFLLFYVADSVLAGLALSLSVLFAFVLLSYAVTTRIFGAKWSVALLGLGKRGLAESFLLASILSIFGPLIQLYVIQTSGMDALVRELLSYPGSLSEILRSLPSSLLFFLIVAVLAFGFFQALPSKFLGQYRTRWVVPTLVAMWVVLYGGANIVLGVAPSPGDIGLFGVIFLAVYLRTKNSVGPILAYVLFAEEPAWVALALLSPGTYTVSLYVKVFWTLAALGITAWLWRNRRAMGSRPAGEPPGSPAQP